MEENEKNTTKNPEDIIKSLFTEAEKNGGLQYILTLLRVTGITCCKDTLIVLESTLKEQKSLKDATVQSCLFNGVEELLCLLGNLLNCSTSKAYKHCFFFPLYKGSFPNIIKPSIEQMLKEIHILSEQTNHPEIASLFDQNFLTNLFKQEDIANDSEYCERAKYFLQTFITIYKSERLKFKERPKLYKLPRFEVLELMINETHGLYGFHLHFSNGSSAHFIRNEDSTDPLNIHFDRNFEMSAFVGDLDALTEEWRVGKKKLYEIGLPGRYNKLGEWKPLVYPAKKSFYPKEAFAISNDEQIQGVVFYIMCTSYQAIEFVVKADIELPWENMTLGNLMHLWKCPNLEIAQNFFIYDGTYYLSSFSVEEIEAALPRINLTLNTIAFTYNAKLQWRLKYNIINSTQDSCIKIEEKDLNVLDAVLKKYPRNKDGLILNSAIDWYNSGTNAKNILAGFLCYYRVIETIVTSIYTGKTDFGLGFQRATRDQARQKSLSCIEKKHNELYNSDKLHFVTSAYSECIQGARGKSEEVLQLIFGSDSKYIKDLFAKPEDGQSKSLYEIRNGIAHGNLTSLEKKDIELVRTRLGDIKMIAKELIMRLIYSLNPSQNLPKWSGMRGMAMSGYDPRTYLITNTEKNFPKDVDWKIKPEWCV